MTDTAGWGRRALALVVDWAASTLVVILLIGTAGWLDDPASGFYVLGVFALESTLLTALAGGSFGKLLTGLRVVRSDGSGRPVDLLRSVGRSVKGADLTDVLNRLKALDANRSNIPLPKGPMPTSMKGMRGQQRGR